jgi:hypothetical protein
MARGRILIATGRFVDAREHFVLWCREIPQSVLPHLGLGCAALAAGDWISAETHFRDILAMRPADARALVGLELSRSDVRRAIQQAGS